MNTTVDRIRRRLAEAEACQALLRNYPSDAIAARIGGLRTALEEAEIAEAEQEEDDRVMGYAAALVRRLDAHHDAIARAEPIPVPPAPNPPAPTDAAPPPAQEGEETQRVEAQGYTDRDRMHQVLDLCRPAVFVGDEVVALAPEAAARMPQPEPPALAPAPAPPPVITPPVASEEAPPAPPEPEPEPPPVHPLAMAPQPEPPAEPEEQRTTLADARTPERDARLRELWPRLSWANGHILTALDSMPGPRIPRSKGTLHYWASKLGLPTARLEAYGAEVPDTTRPEPAPTPAPEPPPAPAPAPEPAPPAAAAAPPAAAPAEAHPERLSHAHRLRAQGHDARSIAKRTGLDLAQVQALEADAKRQAEDLLRQGALSTEDIAAECGLPPATIRTLRTSMKGRAA